MISATSFRLPFLLLLCTIPVHATIAIAHRYNCNPGSSPCNGAGTTVTLTSTTGGNNFYIWTDTTANPASIAFNAGGAFTLYKCVPITTISHLCFWFAENISAGKTSYICTTCGTVNAMHAWEVSGSTSSNSIDHGAPCSSIGGSCNFPANTLAFNPGFSAEAVLYAGNCSGSAASPFVTGTGVTWTAAAPNGEPGADGITSAAGQITAAADSGCLDNGGVIIGVKASGSTQSYTADIGYFDYGTELGSTSNPTVAANLWSTGDLVAVTVWGINGISVSSVTIGIDNATLAVSGNSDVNTGQPFIYYDLSTGVSGAQTITATISGTRTHSQVAYQEFIPSQGCTFSHDIDSSVGTGTGTTVNTLSYSPTAGDLLFDFTASAFHLTGNNSPWLCNQFRGSGETASCFYVNTVNGHFYDLSAAGGSIANNLTQINGAWQGILTSFKLTGPAATVIDSSNGGSVF